MVIAVHFLTCSIVIGVWKKGRSWQDEEIGRCLLWVNGVSRATV